VDQAAELLLLVGVEKRDLVDLPQVRFQAVVGCDGFFLRA